MASSKILRRNRANRRTQGARQFKRDLQKEFEGNVLGGIMEYRDETALDIVDRAHARTRKRTGELRDHWSASRGRYDGKKVIRGGPPQARALLTLAKKPFEVISVHNTSFKASFHEYGTQFMRAKPMLAPVLERHKRRIVRLKRKVRT